MGASAENLECEGLVHPAIPFFQKERVLVFCAGNSAEGGAEADADPRLRLVAAPREPCIIERQQSAGDGELGIAIEPLQAMRWKEHGRIPVAYFSGVACSKGARIKGADSIDPAASGFD